MNLRPLFALANAFKEGDLAVGGTRDEQVRDDARRTLLATTIGDIRRAELLEDRMTEALARTRDRQHDGELDGLALSDVRQTLLGAGAAAWVRRYGDALTSETIAAVARVMDNDELSLVARTIVHPLPGDGVAIGAASHFGSRIQPNSPGDTDEEILFSILDGLVFGCGDVIIGLNPASDDVDSIVHLEQLLEQVVRRLELPTRFCVLSDVVKQSAAARQTRVDVGFQSLAGTSRALTGMVGLDVDGLADLVGRFDGLYFETGQGSEVTNGAAEGADMVTLESRCYGVARHLRRVCTQRAGGRAPWMIVNDVAGFIGPEVFRSAAQLERACLEDTVMARLHGLTMGLDVCSTFHMGIAPAELRALTERIVERAAPAYLMAVAGNADPMLGYLTTSFRQHPPLRRRVQRRMTSAMESRLRSLGVIDRDGQPSRGVDSIARLYATFAAAGGDRRHASTIEDDARRSVTRLRERGFDIGGVDPVASDERVDRLYEHARRSLFATLDDGVLRTAAPNHVRVRTTAMSRDDYLSHSESGERLRDVDAGAVVECFRGRPPQVVCVISDGLNADAINEQAPALMPPLRRALAARGCRVADAVVVVQNGRVRVGYEIGGLIGADAVVHIIGERPGTGLNTASAYLTYGRDPSGQSRWSPALEHSATTAICGIHRHAKTPEAAAEEVARTVARTLTEKRSGVGLQ
jgi:ethanolamine ammonia-lyase large subunit